jgi:uncharacterized protein (DUF58 family)
VTRVSQRLWAAAPQITRDGWLYSLVTLGLAIAGLNTGNNLVYLLVSMLLGVILVSGSLSRQSMRGLRLTPLLPEEVYAGRPAISGAVLRNRKRRLASYAIRVEMPGPAPGGRTLHVPRLGPGAERQLTWQVTLPRRGRHRLPAVWITTRFPFGLFERREQAASEAEVLVFPAVDPVPPERLRRHGGPGQVATRRRGRGDDLYNLRPYRAGDDPRLIHWRSSAKTPELMVRELAEDAARDVRLILTGDARRDAPRFERALSEAASLAVHFLRAGVGVELRGPDLEVPLGRGRHQEHRILTALALYEPGTAPGADPPAVRSLHEVRVGLD